MISKESQNDLYTVTSITRLEYVQTETPLSLWLTWEWQGHKLQTHTDLPGFNQQLVLYVYRDRKSKKHSENSWDSKGMQVDSWETEKREPGTCQRVKAQLLKTAIV